MPCKRRMMKMSAMEDKKAVKRLEDKFRCSLWMDRSLVRHRHPTDGWMDGWMDGWIGDDAWMGGGGDVDTLDEWRRGLNEWTTRAQREEGEGEGEGEKRREERREKRERPPPASVPLPTSFPLTRETLVSEYSQ